MSITAPKRDAGAVVGGTATAAACDGAANPNGEPTGCAAGLHELGTVAIPVVC